MEFLSGLAYRIEYTFHDNGLYCNVSIVSPHNAMRGRCSNACKNRFSLGGFAYCNPCAHKFSHNLRVGFGCAVSIVTGGANGIVFAAYATRRP
ncbi:MAG: hypothetical protein MUO43_04940 [Desulfobacterales bacterium]|nr:hypothetical protein [Desulfobacterales bacterium]